MHIRSHNQALEQLLDTFCWHFKRQGSRTLGSQVQCASISCSGVRARGLRCAHVGVQGTRRPARAVLSARMAEADVKVMLHHSRLTRLLGDCNESVKDMYVSDMIGFRL